MLADGTWYLFSPSDERWNVSGPGRVGMFMTLHECQPAAEEFDRLLMELGEPPADLEFGYVKD